MKRQFALSRAIVAATIAGCYFLLTSVNSDSAVRLHNRFALVIGLGAYNDSAFSHLAAADDARMVSSALKDAGFDTDLVTDATSDQISAAVNAFSKKVAEADFDPTVVVYLSGHVTYNEENKHFYLVGVDEEAGSPQFNVGNDIKEVLRRIGSANDSSLNILFVDAGYTHTAFAERADGTRGFKPAHYASLALDERTVVMVSADRGTTPLDRSSTDRSHGPFALALVSRIKEPGLALSDLLKRVRTDVLISTDEAQDPKTYGPKSLSFYFHPVAPMDPLMRAIEVTYETETGEESTYSDGSYALLVGVSDYDEENGYPDLSSVSAEMDDLAAVLKEVHGFEVTQIKNPTGKELQSAIESFVDQHGQKKNARLLFMFSGHGESKTINGNKLAWFVPRDAPRLSYGVGPFNRVALSMRRIEEWSETMEAKHILWLFDSCFSGAALRMTGHRGDVQIYEGFLHSHPVRRVITAGSEDELVPAQSRFVRRLIDVLAGKVEVGDNDSLLTGNEIGQFLRQDLITFTSRTGTRRQTPQNDTIVIPDEEGDVMFLLEPSLTAAFNQRHSN